MPNKELFNQPLKSTLTDNDRIAVGIPGLTGAYNIEFGRFCSSYGITVVDKARGVNFRQFEIPANSKLISIDIRNAGAVQVTATINSSDSEFDFGSFEIGSNSCFELVINRNKINSYTIDVAITGGNVDINVYYIKNIWQ
jgi:hypothetical protein